jgi:hypothetical protein
VKTCAENFIATNAAKHSSAATRGVSCLADLIARQFDPIRWAIADLIPEGVVLVVGAPKIGKSWLVLQCAIAISAGLSLWSGRCAELQGEVLMLALEDNDRRMASRATKLLSAGVDISRLHYATEWPRADRGGIDALDNWLKLHPCCRMVVIDTLARWRGQSRATESAYAGDYEVGAALKPLADKYGVAIVLVHHSRKAVSSDVLDSASGTLGLTGSVDAALFLRRERGQMDAALYVTGRDIEREEDYALRFDPTTCLWVGVGSVREARVSRERRQILDYLDSHPNTRPKAIADGLGKKPGAVRFLLHRMRADAEVVESGGLYSVPPLTPPNSAISANTPHSPIPPNSGTSSVGTVSEVCGELGVCPRCDGEGCATCDATAGDEVVSI